MLTLLSVFTVLLLFAGATKEQRYCCVLFMIYISSLYYLNHSMVLTFAQYTDFYTISTLCIGVLILAVNTSNKLRQALTVSVVLPQMYYPFLLKYPRMIRGGEYFTWFLSNADTLFGWGVVCLVHERVLEWDFEKLNDKDLVVNSALGIIILLGVVV